MDDLIRLVAAAKALREAAQALGASGNVSVYRDGGMLVLDVPLDALRALGSVESVQAAGSAWEHVVRIVDGVEVVLMTSHRRVEEQAVSA